MGNVFLHGKGGAGGAGLNFKVVGGTTAPSNPKENMIWVNTDAKITSWIFSAIQPSNPSEGMVWITIGESSTVEFNALKKNGIYVYPLFAKQYVNGAWVDKTAKSYQNGKWVEWIDYIYNKGSTAYTFSSVAKKTNSSSGFSAQAPTIKQYDNYVELSIASASSAPRGRAGLVYITEKIDLTDVKTLVFEGDFYQTYNATYPQINIYRQFGTYMDDNVVARKSNIVDTVGTVYRKTVEIDVSAVSGENYIGFSLCSDSNGSVVTSYIKLYQIIKK